jgi:hypothetical protein
MDEHNKGEKIFKHNNNFKVTIVFIQLKSKRIVQGAADISPIKQSHPFALIPVSTNQFYKTLLDQF